MKPLEWPQDNMLIILRSMADNSEVSGGIWQKLELNPIFMHVLVTCKNEGDPIKMNSLERPHIFSHYKSMGIFRFDEGQLTPQPLVRSAQNSNSDQTLWLSLLPERMKKIRSKMGALEWPQGFLHYNPMGALCCHGNQSSDSISPKT